MSSGSPRPRVVVLAGPNGAGKTTVAPRLLRGALQVDEYVNADTIARGLSAFAPERVAFQAGRVMLARLKALARDRVSFAFESTLATRSYVPWLRTLIDAGYGFWLLFLWLPSAELAIARVAERVRRGGHNVPSGIVRRRYALGVHNFWALYLPLATRWRVYDNSARRGPRLVAYGGQARTDIIVDRSTWSVLVEAGRGERRY